MITSPDDDSALTRRVPLVQLPGRQRMVLDAIVRYHRVTGEPCPVSYLARRFSLHHSSVQRHIELLYRKGWLRGSNAPVLPNRR